jgi:hypothetical protein
MKTILFHLFVICLVAFHFKGQSQEKITHEKRIYFSPEGKIYIQKELPVYLRIATSPDEDAESYLLQSEETKAYANPFYLDTEGYNTIRTPSCVDTVTKKALYPIRDVIFELYADATAPITKADFGKNSIHKNNGKIYTSGKLSLSFSATDKQSGINKIYYSIDGAAFKPYQNEINLSEPKEYVIKYYAIDNVGNDEGVKTLNIVLDAAAPVTKLEFEGDQKDNVISGNTSLKLSAEDNHGLNKIFYSLDGAPMKEYKYPIQSKYLSEGDHSITYYATDIVGNKETEHKFDFFVDKTPPTIVQEILGNSIIANGQEYSSGRSRLKLTTFDNKAGVKEIYYSINDGEYQLYEQPFYLSSISGKLNVKAYALDHVNNRSSEDQEVSKSALPYIDLSGPEIKKRFNGPVFVTRDTIFINKQTEIILQASDKESGLSKITYSLDGGPIEIYENPIKLEKEGMHKISFTATDQVDNTNSEDFLVFVDNEGPEIFARFSTQPAKTINNIDVYPSYVVLFFSATDMVVGFSKMIYFMNGSTTPIPYEGYINGFERDKDYKITVKAYDNLGNETEYEVEFKSDSF